MSNEPTVPELETAHAIIMRLLRDAKPLEEQVVSVANILAAHRAESESELADLLTEINRIYMQDESNQFLGYEWLFDKIAPALAAHAAATR